MIKLINIHRHLKTIRNHRRHVRKHCRKCGIGIQGLTHDLSKYSRIEFWPGVRYYQGYRSPNELEREKNGYSQAWMHHKGCNRHHYEYWSDYNPATRMVEPVEMPVRYAAEMFCDRVAAGKTYNGDKYTNSDPLNYFLKSKGRRSIHPATEQLLEGWLRLLSESGEKAAFAKVRSDVKAARKAVRKARRAARRADRAEERAARRSAGSDEKSAAKSAA